jgi:hypothetical protein
MSSSLAEIMRTLSEIRVAVSEKGKMPIDQEVAIRQGAEDKALNQIGQAIHLLSPAINAFNTTDKLPIELREEVERIVAARQILWMYKGEIAAQRRLMYFARPPKVEPTKPP